MAEIRTQDYDAFHDTTTTCAIEDGKVHHVFTATVPQMMIELNRYERDNDPRGVKKGFSMKRIGRVPLALHIWMQRTGMFKDGGKRFREFMNDPANRDFRSSGGKI